MITFENILSTLHELFIEKLPILIEEINKIHNDGLIIYPFENKTLLENCHKLPCFKFELQEAEYSEKNRIIENTVFESSFKIKTKAENEKRIIELCRYEEALEKALKENTWDYIDFSIQKLSNNKIFFRLVL